MDGTLIATTSNAELQTLGTGGQRAIQSWDQIVGYMQRTLGAEHAALFAEPNPDPDRGITDWYAQSDGQAAILGAMEGAAREQAAATLARLHGDIRAASERLRESRREDERFLGEMLSLALIVPGTEYIRVVGSQPVLVAWGHTLINAAADPELLIGALPRTVRGPAARGAVGLGPMKIVGPPLPVASNLWKWVLGALLLACLLLFLPLLALMYDPFHWFGATAAQCVVAPADVALLEELRTVTERETRLRDQIARVALEAGNRRTACPPRVLPAPPPPAPPPEPPKSADAERAEKAGAKAGKVQIILAWDDIDDLDLVVICPDGEKIFFNGTAACGGRLDIDQNREPSSATKSPVESIVFDQPPSPGQYRILVWKYAHRPQAPTRTPFRVTVRQEGQPDRVSTGTAGPDEKVPVEPLNIPAR